MLGQDGRSMLRHYNGTSGQIVLKWGTAVLRPYWMMELKMGTGVSCPYRREFAH